MKERVSFELSKQRIKYPLEKGEIYFLIQYYHLKRPYRYYMAAKTSVEAKEKFNNSFGSKRSPCIIHNIKPERGNDHTKLVIYSQIVSMMDDSNEDYSIIFRRVGVKFNMSASAIRSLYYRVKKNEND